MGLMTTTTLPKRKKPPKRPSATSPKPTASSSNLPTKTETRVPKTTTEVYDQQTGGARKLNVPDPEDFKRRTGISVEEWDTAAEKWARGEGPMPPMYKGTPFEAETKRRTEELKGGQAAPAAAPAPSKKAPKRAPQDVQDLYPHLSSSMQDTVKSLSPNTPQGGYRALFGSASGRYRSGVAGSGFDSASQARAAGERAGQRQRERAGLGIPRGAATDHIGPGGAVRDIRGDPAALEEMAKKAEAEGNPDQAKAYREKAAAAKQAAADRAAGKPPAPGSPEAAAAASKNRTDAFLQGGTRGIQLMQALEAATRSGAQQGAVPPRFVPATERGMQMVKYLDNLRDTNQISDDEYQQGLTQIQKREERGDFGTPTGQQEQPSPFADTKSSEAVAKVMEIAQGLAGTNPTTGEALPVTQEHLDQAAAIYHRIVSGLQNPGVSGGPAMPGVQTAQPGVEGTLNMNGYPAGTQGWSGPAGTGTQMSISTPLQPGTMTMSGTGQPAPDAREVQIPDQDVPIIKQIQQEHPEWTPQQVLNEYRRLKTTGQ